MVPESVTIHDYLTYATRKFELAGIPNPWLDAQVLACQAVKHNKAWLLAHKEDHIPADNVATLLEQTGRREAREPLAYILGWKEFYGRRFDVNQDVLIPRPATEQLIEEIKLLPLPENAHVIDIGTGSGAIAITVALERPQFIVEACDISQNALNMAEKNAKRLNAHVHCFESDLLARAEHQYDCIIANLPYVGHGWQRSPETNYEPFGALFAEDDGLETINELLLQAPEHLNQSGYLALEADPRQFEDIKKRAQAAFDFVHSEGFALILKNKL